MTTVTFYQSNHVLYGFSTEGHTGYAEAGSDILCAAVSSLTIFVVNTIETELSLPVVVDEREDDEDNASITLEVPALFSETRTSRQLTLCLPMELKSVLHCQLVFL